MKHLFEIRYWGKVISTEYSDDTKESFPESGPLDFDWVFSVTFGKLKLNPW